MDNDKEILSRIEGLFEELCETPFDSAYDEHLKDLSFTHTSLAPGKIRTAWTEFLGLIFGEGMFLDWPINIGIAQWYEDKELYAQAISVYEHLLRQIRIQNLLDEASVDFLRALMNLYSMIPVPDAQRTIYLYELISDFYHDGDVGADDYAEATALLAEFKERETRVKPQKEEKEAAERLLREHGALLRFVNQKTWKYLINAERFSCSADESVYEHVPVYFAKAIESEFNQKIFLPNHKSLKAFLESQGEKSKLDHLTTGRIKNILENIDSNIGLSVIFSKCHGGVGLGSPVNLRKIGILKQHRNQNVHGSTSGPQYTRSQLEELLAEIRTDGWIFQFLIDLQSRENN